MFLLLAVTLLLASCSQSASMQTDAGEQTWESEDIGAPLRPGHFEVTEGQMVVEAGGRDIWETSDSFHYVFQQLDDEAGMTVRIDEISDAPSEWTKFGIMIRESLDPSARNAMIHLTRDNGVIFQFRQQDGGETVDVLSDGPMQVSGVQAPIWLQVKSSGDSVIGSYSQDGNTWTELGRVELPMGDNPYAGIAVTSRDEGDENQSAEAVFSNYILLPPETSPSPTPPSEPSPPAPEPTPPDDPAPPPVIPPEPIEGPVVTASYSEIYDDFRNPERGWHGGGNATNYASVYGSGHTLVRQYFRLDDYRYSDIPESKLEEWSEELAALRDHGLKIILGFSYNHGNAPDAPLEWVLRHIEQVTPMVREYSDVIAVLQAGFIGYWGEWHSSTNGLLELGPRREITEALLDMVPESRMIQIRYPYRASDMYPNPVNESNAFNNSDVARVGQKNDCFLANSRDAGTYLDDSDRDYVEAVTEFTVMGGETCQVGSLGPRNDGDTALVELERYHWDYLGHDFYLPIIDKWRSQGHYEEITRRLGYRYVMDSAEAQSAALAGGNYSVNLQIGNVGFGKLYNPRPLNIVLVPHSGGAPEVLRAYNDARHVLPLAGENVSLPITVQLPASLPSGQYDVYLALPDDESDLAGDNRYAIRFANDGTWNSSNGGMNNLNLVLNVD